MPHQLANRPRAHPPPSRLSRRPHAGLAEYPVLIPLSRGYPGEGGRLPTCYSAVRHSCGPRGGPTVRLACVRRAASVHPEPGSNSPSKMYWASGPSGPLSPSLIGSVRFIWFKYRKRNFSGPPLGGLAKNKSKSDHFKWFDVCPDATHLVCPSSQYPVLKVHACAVYPVRPGRAARRYIARPRSRVGRQFHSSQVLHNLWLSIQKVESRVQQDRTYQMMTLRLRDI